MSFSLHAYIFKQLLAADLIIFYESLKDKLVNLFIWVGITLVVMGYIMPAFGLTNFGPFQLAGLIASAGLFEVYPSAMSLVQDFSGDRIISYHLTLPLPSWLVLIKTITYYALNALTLSLCVIPMGKLVLWNQFDLTAVSWPHFLFFMVLVSVFYGVFTLWIASRAESIEKMGNVWMRFIFPMWFLGGFQFSWKALYSVFPALGYVGLINPMTYVMEGTRATVLGPSGYLPFWVTALAVLICILGFGYNAIKRIKRRLDFV